MIRREIDEAAEQALRAQVKVQLRQRMRSLRRVLPAEARAARSAAICANLLALPEFTRARTIVAYRATPTEADPGAALATAQADGKLIGLPRVVADGQLTLHVYREDDALELSAFGLHEPHHDAAAIADDAVELIIVPALVFDDRGHRVGYGHGYYDRLLPRLTRAFKVVVGYDFQRVMQAPESPHDVPVNCVITDARTVRV